jgi:hypothetical protein
MYLRAIKALAVDALVQTFGTKQFPNSTAYPNAKFSNTLNISIEYPVEPQNYPGIWVDYEDQRPLEIAGIAHREIDPEGKEYTRWKYGGHISYTIVAMTSLERDELYDEVVRTIAFGAQNSVTSNFRQTIENNDLIACNLDFDTLQPGGSAAAPGTPWGSDEIIYEKTITQQAIGEFIVDPDTGALVLLDKLIIVGRTDGTEEDPINPTEVDVTQNRDPSTLSDRWI